MIAGNSAVASKAFGPLPLPLDSRQDDESAVRTNRRIGIENRDVLDAVAGKIRMDRRPRTGRCADAIGQAEGSPAVVEIERNVVGVTRQDEVDVTIAIDIGRSQAGDAERSSERRRLLRARTPA